MKFDQLVSKFLSEKKEDVVMTESPVPVVIEITKDSSRSKLYNDLGETVIKLAQIRNKLKN